MSFEEEILWYQPKFFIASSSACETLHLWYPWHQKNVYTIMLTAEEIKIIDHEISLVPYRKAAGIEALKIVQLNRGWVSDEILHEVAGYMGMSDEELDSIATFYNLIFRKPVGRHVILICDSISCYVMGC